MHPAHRGEALRRFRQQRDRARREPAIGVGAETVGYTRSEDTRRHPRGLIECRLLPPPGVRRGVELFAGADDDEGAQPFARDGHRRERRIEPHAPAHAGVHALLLRAVALYDQPRAQAHQRVGPILTEIPHLHRQHVVADAQIRREIDRVEMPADQVAALGTEADRRAVDEEPVAVVRREVDHEARGLRRQRKRFAEQEDAILRQRDARRSDPGRRPAGREERGIHRGTIGSDGEWFRRGGRKYGSHKREGKDQSAGRNLASDHGEQGVAVVAAEVARRKI